jgi:hypothetical protein
MLSNTISILVNNIDVHVVSECYTGRAVLKKLYGRMGLQGHFNRHTDERVPTNF